MKLRNFGAAALALGLAGPAGAQNYNIAVRLAPPTLANNSNSPSLYVSPNGGGLYVSLLDPTSGAFLGTSGAPLVTTSSGTAAQAITYAAPGSTVAIATSSTSVLGAAAYTHALILCTEPTDVGNVWLNLAGGAAVVNVGAYVPAAGGCLPLAPPTAAVTGISDSGTSHLTIQGG